MTTNTPIKQEEKVSNNQLLKKYYTEMYIPHEKAYEDEMWGEEHADACTLCSIAFGEDYKRDDLVAHLWNEHKEIIIKENYQTKGHQAQ